MMYRNCTCLCTEIGRAEFICTEDDLHCTEMAFTDSVHPKYRKWESGLYRNGPYPFDLLPADHTNLGNGSSEGSLVRSDLPFPHPSLSDQWPFVPVTRNPNLRLNTISVYSSCNVTFNNTAILSYTHPFYSTWLSADPLWMEKVFVAVQGICFGVAQHSSNF